MRLAIKLSAPSKKSGSAYTFARNLIPMMYQKNADIKLFTGGSTKVFSEIEGLETLSINYAENPFLQKSALKKITSWIYQQATWENQLIKQEVDVLYCPFNYEALFSTRKIPQVVTVHDLIPLMWQKDFKATSTLWKYVYIPTIKNVNAVITVSENTKQDILKFCDISSDKIFVIPNGFSSAIDSNEADINTTDDNNTMQPYILYVCSTHYPYKNLVKLFEAYNIIRHSFPHKLVVVGRSVPRFTPQLREKISELGLSEKIVLLEGISNTELSRMYKGADLFVYPSLYEGFGIPPLEAMFHGTPVVASQAASIPEVCGEAALYIDPNSIDNIADGIIKGLTDSDLRQRLKLAGNERIKLFTWEKTANKILEVCQMVMH